jgi:hypothetical protein
LQIFVSALFPYSQDNAPETADYDIPTPPPTTTLPPITFGKTTLKFSGPGYPSNHIDNTSVTIPYNENPTRPYGTITTVVPIIRLSMGKANNRFGPVITSTHIFDSAAGTFSLTLDFGTTYVFDGEMTECDFEIDFLVA